MEPVYKQVFSVTELHTDRFGRLKPSMLLYFSQEVSGHHAALLGSGTDILEIQHLFWAVVRQRVQITRLPQAGEQITVETWPMPTTRAAYPRATLARDRDGKELFRTVALWVLMDSRTRTLVLPGKSGIVLPGTLRGNELTAPGSLAPRELAHTVRQRVGFTLLDRNGHMNNTRCLDLVQDLLPSSFHEAHPIREFTVCYLSEAREGQELSLSWTLSEDAVLQADARRADTALPDSKERIFTAQIRF